MQRIKIDNMSIFIDNMFTQMANCYLGESYAMSFQLENYREFKENIILWHSLHDFHPKMRKKKYF